MWTRDVKFSLIFESRLKRRVRSDVVQRMPRLLRLVQRGGEVLAALLHTFGAVTGRWGDSTWSPRSDSTSLCPSQLHVLAIAPLGFLHPFGKDRKVKFVKEKFI